MAAPSPARDCLHGEKVDWEKKDADMKGEKVNRYRQGQNLGRASDEEKERTRRRGLA